MPIIATYFPVLHISTRGYWLLWAGSIMFLLGWLTLKWRAPHFIQQYANYSAYKLHGHSHRFVVWELYNNFSSIGNKAALFRETIEKHLSRPHSDYNQDTINFDATSREAKRESSLRVFRPINLNRDIHLPFSLQGDDYMLSMEEHDPELKEKEKELFWIIYAEQAGGRETARMIVWSLFYTSGALVAISVLLNIYKAIE
jgi:hypothetical protein